MLATVNSHHTKHRLNRFKATFVLLAEVFRLLNFLRAAAAEPLVLSEFHHRVAETAKMQ